MKNFFSLWIVLLCPFIITAQTITVIHSETKEPIPAVTIQSESPNLFTTTNAKGKADIRSFKQSKRIVIRSLGFKPLELDFATIESLQFRIVLTPLILQLDQIVVSASRWQQASPNSPAEIKTITPVEVALQNPQTAADLLGISGNVFIQKSQQGGGSPMIRGFATNRLLYTVDGVRMNTAIFRSGNIQNVINLDPFATESTEILFGPGSVLFGSDAIGGVMSFQTLTPQLSLNDSLLFSGKSVARYSSANNENTVHFDVTVGGKKWAFVSSFSSWDFGNLQQGRFGPDDFIKREYVKRINGEDVVVTQDKPLLQIPTAYSQYNLMQKVRYKPSANWDLNYGFHYSTTSDYGRYDRHNRRRNGTLRYAEWDYGPQSWLMHLVSVQHSGENLLYDHTTVRIAFQKFTESRIDRNLFGTIRNTQDEAVDAVSVNLDFTKQWNSRNQLFYGFEYVYNNIRSSGSVTNLTDNSITKGASRYPNSEWKTMATYLNNEFSYSKKLIFNTGIRYSLNGMENDFSQNSAFYSLPFTTTSLQKGSLTGSLGLVYRHSPSLLLKVNTGTAFRSPNVDDIGKIFDSVPGTVTVPNPDLTSEYAWNVDVGMAKLFGDLVKLDITGYYTVLTDALVRRNFTLNGKDSMLYNGEMSRIQAIQNAAQAFVYGVQFGFSLNVGNGFQWNNDLNVQVGEEELDDGSTSASRHAAPLFGISRLRFQKESLTLELNTQFQAKRNFEDLAFEEQQKDEIYAKDSNGNNYAPAWYTLNLKATYRFSKTYMLSVGLENITDQRYRAYSSGISGAGRNAVFSFTAHF